MTLARLTLISLTLALGLSACAGNYNRPKVQEPQIAVSPDSVTVRLAEAADRASRSLETLAAVEQYRNPQADISAAPNAPMELRRTISVNWFGPVEQIAQTVASRASYNFEVFGNTPPTPIIVTIKSNNRQVIDVFRDIGLQIGAQANLRVDASRRVVELYYPSALNKPDGG